MLSWLSRAQSVGSLTRQFAIAGECAHRKIHISCGFVGVPGLNQLFDQLDDLGDRLTRQRLVVRPAQSEPVGVTYERFGHSGGEGV